MENWRRKRKTKFLEQHILLTHSLERHHDNIFWLSLFSFVFWKWFKRWQWKRTMKHKSFKLDHDFQVMEISFIFLQQKYFQMVSWNAFPGCLLIQCYLIFCTVLNCFLLFIYKTSYAVLQAVFLNIKQSIIFQKFQCSN